MIQQWREVLQTQCIDFFQVLRGFGVYTLASAIKVIVGFSVLILTLTQLNVREDLELALTMLLIGCAMFSRGIAYFLFRGGQELFLIEIKRSKIQKESYKASLIFGMYSFLNVLWIVMGWRNYRWGLVFLLVLGVSQRMIFNPGKKLIYDR